MRPQLTSMSGGSGSWIATGGRDRFKAFEGVKFWRRGRELVEEEAMPPSDDIVRVVCFFLRSGPCLFRVG